MLSLVPKPLRILYICLIGAFIIFSAFQLQILIAGRDPDWMFLAGSSACLLGLAPVLGIDKRIDHAVTAMIHGGVIYGLERTTILAQMDRSATRSARLVMAIVVVSELVVVLTGFILVPCVLGDTPLIQKWDSSLSIGKTDVLTFVGLLTVGPLASALVGWYLGKFAVYGRLQKQVAECGGLVVMQPDADDQMGGLRPLVRIVRGQALLTLAPVVWLVLWLVLTAVNETFRNELGFWRLPFFMLLAVAVLYSTLGFFAPLRLLEEVLTEQAERTRDMDPEMSQRVLASVANARRHITPRSWTYLLLLAFFAGCILLAGFWLPSNTPQGMLSLFFFGPL